MRPIVIPFHKFLVSPFFKQVSVTRSPPVPSVLVTVLIFAPLFGAIIERVLMRRLSDAPLVAKLVVTIGLMVALMGLAVTVWNPNVARSIPTFYGTDGFTIGSTCVPWFRFITSVTGLLRAVIIRIVLYRTRLGVAMRAVVDQRELAALNGARPGLTSSFAWGLGTSMEPLESVRTGRIVTTNPELDF